MNLQDYLFQGLINQNDGFDDANTIYVSAQDLETVLNRAEAKKIEIYGIEPFLKNSQYDYFGVEIHENWNLPADDPNWYRSAFAKLNAKNPHYVYTISFGLQAI